MTRPGGAGHRVAAVIPALDEATAIGELSAGLLANGACCVFVVDGGSVDGTPDVARAAGAVVIDEPRRGYGRACLTGAEAAGSEHAILAFLDGDGSCDSTDLRRLLDALDRNGAGLVLGMRSPRTNEPGALPWHAHLGNLIVAGILSLRTRRRIRDLPPFKVIRRDVLAVLDLNEAGFGWTVQLIARALRNRGLTIMETSARFRRRRGGQSKVSGSIRASIAAGRRMVECAWIETRPRPLIALMAKAPRAGHAKTRLAAEIGQEAALELWAACLADLGPALRGAARGFADTIAVVPAIADAETVAELLGPGWSIVVQGRAGLAGAIVDAFAEAEARGADRAIAVSGDNPTLPPELLLAALDALRVHPSVLGPCPDGGYYLVGSRLDGRRGTKWRPGLGGHRRLGIRGSDSPRRPSLVPRLERVFEAARLGGGMALASTAAALVAERLPPRWLDPWPDIDTAADLAYLAASLNERRPAPRTRAWVEAHAGLIPTGEREPHGADDPG